MGRTVDRKNEIIGKYHAHDKAALTGLTVEQKHMLINARHARRALTPQRERLGLSRSNGYCMHASGKSVPMLYATQTLYRQSRTTPV